MSKTSTILIILLVVAAGIFGYIQSEPTENEISTEEWETHTNQEFGFSVKHPPEWEVFEAENDPITPKFNIYKPIDDMDELPFTHHSQTATHVSVFPEGIPTEGVFGQSEESDVDFQVPASNARDFSLAEGEIWATMANVSGPEETWNQSGFLFSQVNIEDHTTECFRGEDLLPDEQCDPLTGDQIIHHGSIDQDDRQITEANLRSFTFTELE